MGRRKFYETIDEMQKDLEVYLKSYNESKAASRLEHEWPNASGSLQKGLEKNKKHLLESMKK